MNEPHLTSHFDYCPGVPSSWRLASVFLFILQGRKERDIVVAFLSP